MVAGVVVGAPALLDDGAGIGLGGDAAQPGQEAGPLDLELDVDAAAFTNAQVGEGESSESGEESGATDMHPG